MKFLIDKNKKYFKFLQLGNFRCSKCKRSVNSKGKYVVLQDKGTQATDGSQAYRIFFVCNDRSHLSFVGYTKPVDFRDINGGDMNKDIKRYDEEEEEEEWYLNDLLGHKKVY